MVCEIPDEQASMNEYFSSPEEAVSKIADLLRQEDFKTLARYYDLSNSDTKLADLQSGEFFVRTERPEISHPVEFWRYKHPFSPGFEYSGMRPSAREDVYVITVRVSIDQGSDSPMQEGYSEFYMIKSAKGWQVLPDPVVEDNSGPEIVQ